MAAKKTTKKIVKKAVKPVAKAPVKAPAKVTKTVRKQVVEEEEAPKRRRRGEGPAPKLNKVVSLDQLKGDKGFIMKLVNKIAQLEEARDSANNELQDVFQALEEALQQHFGSSTIEDPVTNEPKTIMHRAPRSDPDGTPSYFWRPKPVGRQAA